MKERGNKQNKFNLEISIEGQITRPGLSYDLRFKADESDK